jgi:DNA-binding MarR family transcriptional regulator
MIAGSEAPNTSENTEQSEPRDRGEKGARLTGGSFTPFPSPFDHGAFFDMSIAAMNLVWNADCGTHTSKLVLLSLADNANNQGIAWPSVTTIAARCGLSRRAVIANLAELEKRGLVRAEKRAGKGTKYTLQLVNEGYQCISRTGDPDAQTGERGLPALVNEGNKLVNEGHPNHQEPPVEPPRTTKKENLPHGEKFAIAWAEWQQHRKEKRSTLTPTASKRQLATLAAIPEDEAIARIEQSIAQSWTGLFPIKSTAHANNGKQPKARL